MPFTPLSPAGFKTELDTAFSGKVATTGDETIAGVKTFTSSPVVPTPTTDLQAATKKYVDDNAGIPLSPFVSTAGDHGLVLPGVSIHGAANDLALGATTVMHWPILLTATTAFDRIVLEIMVAGAATTKYAGIMNADADWQPTSLIVQASYTADATGVQSFVIDETLTAGRYLLSMYVSTSATYRGLPGTLANGHPIMPTLGANIPYTRRTSPSGGDLSAAVSGLTWNQYFTGGDHRYPLFLRQKVAA